MFFSTLSNLLPEGEMVKYKDFIPSNQTPLWKHWSEFAEYQNTLGRSFYTLRNVRDSLRFIVRRAEIYTIEDLNNKKLFFGKFSELKHGGMSHACLNSYLKNLKAYIRWLKSEDIIKVNNLSEIQKFSVKPKEQPAASQELIDKVALHLQERQQTLFLRYRNQFIFDLFRYLAIRPCELVDIDTSDIREYNGTLQLMVMGKKQKGRVRYYVLKGQLKASYLAYVAYRKKIGRGDEEKLLVSSSKKMAITVNGIRLLFGHIYEESGLKITPYMIRRYVATKLYNNGHDLNKIKDYLGHTNVKTTMVYIERTGCLTEAALDVMLGG